MRSSGSAITNDNPVVLFITTKLFHGKQEVVMFSSLIKEIELFLLELSIKMKTKNSSSFFSLLTDFCEKLFSVHLYKTKAKYGVVVSGVRMLTPQESSNFIFNPRIDPLKWIDPWSYRGEELDFVPSNQSIISALISEYNLSSIERGEVSPHYQFDKMIDTTLSRENEHPNNIENSLTLIHQPNKFKEDSIVPTFVSENNDHTFDINSDEQGEKSDIALENNSSKLHSQTESLESDDYINWEPGNLGTQDHTNFREPQSPKFLPVLPSLPSLPPPQVPLPSLPPKLTPKEVHALITNPVLLPAWNKLISNKLSTMFLQEQNVTSSKSAHTSATLPIYRVDRLLPVQVSDNVEAMKISKDDKNLISTREMLKHELNSTNKMIHHFKMIKKIVPKDKK